jgi:hypothetical protein
MKPIRLSIILLLAAFSVGCYCGYRYDRARVLTSVVIDTRAPEIELIYPPFDFSEDGSYIFISKHWIIRCLAVQQDKNAYGVIEPNYANRDCWKGHEKDDEWHDLRKDFEDNKLGDGIVVKNSKEE